MKRYLHRLPLKSEFVNNAFRLTVGTGIAQIIPIISYPVLSRVFTPWEFGVLGILSSITIILTAMASGNYEYSILITETKNDSINIIGLVLILSFSFLLFSSIILQIFANQIGILVNEPSLKKWIIICPISAFMIIIYNCYNEYCVRNKHFAKISFNKITNSAAISLSKLILGFVKIFENGLVMGDVGGRIISAGACVIRFMQKDRKALVCISFTRMKYLLKRFIEFPKLGLPAELLNTIGVSIPILFIGALFNSKEVGYYTMTMNVISIPIGVIAVSIRDVFRQRANAEYIETGKCVGIFTRLLRIMVIAGFLGSLIVFFILPSIFSTVLGAQWRIAGEYSQILLPMITLSFIYTSLSGIFVITEKMNVHLYWQVYYIVITILSLYLGFRVFHEIKSVLICFTIGRSSAYLLNIYLSYLYSKGKNANHS